MSLYLKSPTLFSCREKSDLLDTMQKMKQMVGDLRDRESDAAKKVKNSLEIVEQMQVEKAQVRFHHYAIDNLLIFKFKIGCCGVVERYGDPEVEGRAGQASTAHS